MLRSASCLITEHKSNMCALRTAGLADRINNCDRPKAVHLLLENPIWGVEWLLNYGIHHRGNELRQVLSRHEWTGAFQ